MNQFGKDCSLFNKYYHKKIINVNNLKYNILGYSKQIILKTIMKNIYHIFIFLYQILIL